MPPPPHHADHMTAAGRGSLYRTYEAGDCGILSVHTTAAAAVDGDDDDDDDARQCDVTATHPRQLLFTGVGSCSATKFVLFGRIAYTHA